MVQPSPGFATVVHAGPLSGMVAHPCPLARPGSNDTTAVTVLPCAVPGASRTLAGLAINEDRAWNITPAATTIPAAEPGMKL